ncbi:MAG: orotate phosphoribosyltransferase [Flavobacteriaceae bacterium TMED171]|nr:orotate phosphoribosyltransferase [Flavobacteriaceae bacterium]OUW31595.1 MAG: orotate phosphoribosyltransferase [Flavobacteriaceae bacterium TMED171]|tara:strand:+ start:3832 stop:4476 length:645 start_codon:yes stop_codon:yes gene_type:complete
MVYDKKTAKQTAKSLLQINAIKLNPKKPFTWASGWKSPIYCDNRIALSFPEIRSFLAHKIAEQAQKIYSNDYVIAGVATGAIGIGMLVANFLNAPFIYVRPEPKSHGRQNQIEGQLDNNKKVLVIEDLISTGKSSLNAVKALKKEGVDVLGMMGLFDYGFDLAIENFKKENIQLHTLSDYHHLIDEAEKSKFIESEDIALLKSWRISPYEWQPN